MKSFNIQVVLGLTLIACGGDEPEEHHEHPDPAEEACEAMANGPATALTATATDTGTAALHEGDRRFDITLADLGGGDFGGFVTMEAAAHADYTFFLSADVPLAFTDADLDPVAIEETDDDFTACDAVLLTHTLALDEEDYTIELGPTTATELRVVVQGAPHDHGH